MTVLVAPAAGAAADGGTAPVHTHTAPLLFASTGAAESGHGLNPTGVGVGFGSGSGFEATVVAPFGALRAWAGARVSLVLHDPFPLIR